MSYTTISSILGFIGGGCLGHIIGSCWDDPQNRRFAWCAAVAVASILGIQFLLAHHEVNYKIRDVPVVCEEEQ